MNNWNPNNNYSVSTEEFCSAWWNKSLIGPNPEKDTVYRQAMCSLVANSGYIYHSNYFFINKYLPQNSVYFYQNYVYPETEDGGIAAPSIKYNLYLNWGAGRDNHFRDFDSEEAQTYKTTTGCNYIKFSPLIIEKFFNKKTIPMLRTHGLKPYDEMDIKEKEYFDKRVLAFNNQFKNCRLLVHSPQYGGYMGAAFFPTETETSTINFSGRTFLNVEERGEPQTDGTYNNPWSYGGANTWAVADINWYIFFISWFFLENDEDSPFEVPVPIIDSKDENSKLSVDWKGYIDGNFKPYLTFSWDGRGFNDYLSPDDCTVDIYINNGLGDDFGEGISGEMVEQHFITNGKLVASVPFTDKKYSLSFEKAIEIMDYNLFAKLLNKLASWSDTMEVGFMFVARYTRNGNEKTSGKACFGNISSKGTIGLVKFIPEKGFTDFNDTIVFTQGTYPDDNPDNKDSENSDSDDPEHGDVPTINGVNLVSTSYAMTDIRMKQMTSFLWSASFYDNIKLLNNSPIENIVSCKLYPFILSSGADEEIVLGNVNTGINGKVINTSTYSQKIDIPSLSLPRHFNSFLDFEPYTTLTLFMPFIGFQDLQPTMFIGKSIGLEYIFDIITGTCKANLKCNGNTVQSYDGSIGIDLPLNSSNRAQLEGSIVSSLVGSVVTKNPMEMLGAMKQQFSTSQKGSFSASTGVCQPLKPFVIIDRPTLKYPANYGKNIGYMCNQVLSLSGLTGYTEVDDNVDLSGIVCSEDERTQIRRLLSQGVFL